MEKGAREGASSTLWTVLSQRDLIPVDLLFNRPEGMALSLGGKYFASQVLSSLSLGVAL